MGSIIPYFYYDLLARIVPGALTLAVLAYCPIKPPAEWTGLLSAEARWTVVAVPLILLAASYVIGVLYEVLFVLPPLSWLNGRWKGATYREAFSRVPAELQSELWEYRPHQADTLTKAQRDADGKKSNKLWEEVMRECSSEPKLHQLFALAHRFQAEANGCLHCVLPSLALAGISIHKLWAWHGLGLAPILLAAVSLVVVAVALGQPRGLAQPVDGKAFCSGRFWRWFPIPAAIVAAMIVALYLWGRLSPAPTESALLNRSYPGLFLLISVLFAFGAYARQLRRWDGALWTRKRLDDINLRWRAITRERDC